MTLVLCTPRVMFENSFFKKGLIDIRLCLRFNTRDSLFHLQFNVYFKPVSHSIYYGKAKGGIKKWLKKTIILLVLYFLQFYLTSLREKEYLAKLNQHSGAGSPALCIIHFLSLKFIASVHGSSFANLEGGSEVQRRASKRK